MTQARTLSFPEVVKSDIQAHVVTLVTLFNIQKFLFVNQLFNLKHKAAEVKRIDCKAFTK